MCVMWFRASDMGKTTFSKCFVVLSVMLGGEFSFWFALGQIQPRDKISSQSLEFGITSAKAEAESGAICFVRTRRGFPVNRGKTRSRVQSCSRASAWASPAPRVLGLKRRATQVSLPHAPRSSACQEIRLYCSRQGVNAESQLGFSFPCNLISPTEPGVLGRAVQDQETV